MTKITVTHQHQQNLVGVNTNHILVNSPHYKSHKITYKANVMLFATFIQLDMLITHGKPMIVTAC